MDNAEFDKGLQQILENHEDDGFPVKADWDRLNAALPPTLSRGVAFNKWWVGIPLALLIASNCYLGWTVMKMGDQMVELKEEVDHHQNEIGHVGSAGGSWAGSNKNQGVTPAPLAPSDTVYINQENHVHNHYHNNFSNEKGLAKAKGSDLENDKLRQDLMAQFIQYLKDHPEASEAFLKEVMPNTAKPAQYAQSTSPENQFTTQDENGSSNDSKSGQISPASQKQAVPSTPEEQFAHPSQLNLQKHLEGHPETLERIKKSLKEKRQDPTNPDHTEDDNVDEMAVEDVINHLSDQPQLVQLLAEEIGEDDKTQEMLENLAETAVEQQKADSLALLEKKRHRNYLDSLGREMAKIDETEAPVEETQKGFSLASNWLLGGMLGYSLATAEPGEAFTYRPVGLRAEWRAENRFGLISGLDYSDIEIETHGTVPGLYTEKVPNFPFDQLPDFNETKVTMSILEVPFEARYYVLPEATVAPFLLAGIKSSLAINEKVEFKDEGSNLSWSYKPDEFNFSLTGIEIGTGARMAFGNQWSGVIRVSYRKGLPSLGEFGVELGEFNGQFHVMYMFP